MFSKCPHAYFSRRALNVPYSARHTKLQGLSGALNLDSYYCASTETTSTCLKPICLKLTGTARLRDFLDLLHRSLRLAPSKYRQWLPKTSRGPEFLNGAAPWSHVEVESMVQDRFLKRGLLEDLPRCCQSSGMRACGEGLPHQHTCMGSHVMVQDRKHP